MIKQRVLLVGGFFGAMPLIIFTLILYSLFLLYSDTANLGKNLTLFRNGVHFKALPEPQKETVIVVEPIDARVSTLEAFFHRYKSPLEPYAAHVVKTADQYGLDYRYVPAIAMQESNLCHKMPSESFNCWGYGVYGGKIKRFVNYDTAIEAVTQTLAQEYKEKGLTEPHEIMQKYTPSSNGSWAASVSYFMDQIQASL